MNTPGARIMQTCLFHRGRRGAQADMEVTRRAFTEISALNSLETGQPVSAPLTAASNLALSALGIVATRSRWLLVMENPRRPFERNRTGGFQLRSDHACVAELLGKRHGEAARMGRGQQLFGVGSYAIFEAGRERILRLFQCAAIG